MKVFIVLKEKPRSPSEREELKKQIIEYCRDNIAHYKAPRTVEFRESLPKSDTGKILAKELREPYWKPHEKRIH